MDGVSEGREPSSPEQAALPIDGSRLAIMRSVKRLEITERIALLDRVCREQTRIAIGAHKARWSGR